MTDPLIKSRLSDFTRTEFVSFVEDICHNRAETEELSLKWVRHFDRLVAPHPQRNGLIFWPEEGADDSPEGITAEIERFINEQGLPGFRAE